MQHNDSYNENSYGFVNNITTPEGGTHIVGFRNALTKTFNEYARKNKLLKDNEPNLSGEDIREGLTAIISVKIDSPLEHVRFPVIDIQIQAVAAGQGHMGHEALSCELCLHRHIGGIRPETDAPSRCVGAQIQDSLAHLLRCFFWHAPVDARLPGLVQSVDVKRLLQGIPVSQALDVQPGFHCEIAVDFSYFHFAFPFCRIGCSLLQIRTFLSKDILPQNESGVKSYVSQCRNQYTMNKESLNAEGAIGCICVKKVTSRSSLAAALSKVTLRFGMLDFK